jgi:hypothetical protein
MSKIFRILLPLLGFLGSLQAKHPHPHPDPAIALEPSAIPELLIALAAIGAYLAWHQFKATKLKGNIS